MDIVDTFGFNQRGLDLYVLLPLKQSRCVGVWPERPKGYIPYNIWRQNRPRWQEIKAGSCKPRFESSKKNSKRQRSKAPMPSVN